MNHVFGRVTKILCGIFKLKGKKGTKYWVVISLLIGEGNGTPLQYSFLENPMDGGAWWATVHGVAKSQTRLSDFSFSFS